MVSHAGHDDTGAAALLHVADQGEGHTAGDGRAEVAALGRVQIFVAFQKAAGMSGHRAEEVPYCDIHKRVFLARASRMRQVQDASVECGVLAGEDPAEQGEGRAGSGGS